MRKIFRVLIAPIETFISCYGRVLSPPNVMKTVLLGTAGLFLGWWTYVPVHEFLHAAGCVLGGGRVESLEIAPLYGGRILSDMFSFVVPAGEYAGRLSGFDTHGSDWIYGLTVFFPYVLTPPSFILLNAASGKRSPFLFGFVLPGAFAPVISLSGDFFEIGGLVLYQLWPGASGMNRVLISDDVFRLINHMGLMTPDLPFHFPTVSFITISFFTGAVMAWATIVSANEMRGLLRKHGSHG